MLVRLARQQELGLGQKLEKVSIFRARVITCFRRGGRPVPLSTSHRLATASIVAKLCTQCDCNVFAGIFVAHLCNGFASFVSSGVSVQVLKFPQSFARVSRSSSCRNPMAVNSSWCGTLKAAQSQSWMLTVSIWEPL
jgi:hypothetical protein